MLQTENISRIFNDGTYFVPLTLKEDENLHTKDPSRQLKTATTNPPPAFKNGLINRILIYTGSFNPPHLGHFGILNHAFYHSGTDQNIIAAIINFMPPEHIASKCKGESQAVVFSQTERERLWRDYPDFPPWAWVFKQDVGGLKKFQDDLKKMVQLDGCEVEYVRLTGPDILPDRRPGTRAKFSFGCNKRIVCDLKRRCKIVTGGVLTPLKGFAPWKKVGVVKKVEGRELKVRTNEEREVLSETAGTGDLIGRDSELVEQEAPPLSILYDTYRLDDPGAKVRFVHCPEEGPRSCEDCLRKSGQKDKANKNIAFSSFRPADIQSSQVGPGSQHRSDTPHRSTNCPTCQPSSEITIDQQLSSSALRRILETTFPFEQARLDALKRAVLSPELLIAMWEEHLDESSKDVLGRENSWNVGYEIGDENAGNKDVAKSANEEAMEDTKWNQVRNPDRKGRRSKKTVTKE